MKRVNARNKANGYAAQREALKKTLARQEALGWPILKANLKAAAEATTTHGLSSHPLYRIWRGMLARCSDRARERERKHYFDRGICVCERWQGDDGLKNFIADMGERPLGYSIDRIDPDGDYSPENCRWATYRKQARNKGKVYEVPRVVLRWYCGRPSFKRSQAAA